VRSRIKSRSNSASAAKTWKTSLPPGVVVVWMLSCSDRNPTPRSASIATRVDQMPKRSAQAIQPPHDKRVVLAQVIEQPR
jgi:hypothetical protein